MLGLAGSWERPEEDAVNIEWARAAWRDLRRFSTGGTYVSFLTEAETGERVRAAHGGSWDRLVADAPGEPGLHGLCRGERDSL
mgnify:CR=1 FL=1